MGRLGQDLPITIRGCPLQSECVPITLIRQMSTKHTSIDDFKTRPAAVQTFAW